MLDIHPVTLEGQAIQLQPLALEHWPALWAVGSDESLWRWSPRPIRSAEEMRAYVETALREQEQGTVLPFVTVHEIRDPRASMLEAPYERARVGTLTCGAA